MWTWTAKRPSSSRNTTKDNATPMPRVELKAILTKKMMMVMLKEARECSVLNSD